MTDTQQLIEEIEEAVGRLEEKLKPLYKSGSFDVFNLKVAIEEELTTIASKSAEIAKKEFEDNDIEVTLDTKQCLEVAQMIYEKYQEAMKPPVFAVYQFPDWLSREIEALSQKESQ